MPTRRNQPADPPRRPRLRKTPEDAARLLQERIELGEELANRINPGAYVPGVFSELEAEYLSGNVLTQLDGLARDEALSPTSYPDLDGYVATVADSASRAMLLSSVNTYSSDGTELLDALGPTHPVMLSTGNVVDGRIHLHTTYDEGAPIGGPYRLATTVTFAAQDPAGSDHDTLTVHKTYDPIITNDTSGWTLRKPTGETTVMGAGANIVRITRYDSQGRVIEVRLPANTNGGDARATLSAYYAATGTGNCVNVAEAGLLCQSTPAGQPTSGPPLPTTTMTYNMWGRMLTLTEANGTGSRTTTAVYDSVQRECVHGISTAGVGDVPVPGVYTAYDSISGLATLSGNMSASAPTTCPVTQPALSSSVQSAYDSDGRINTYVDASGTVSSVTYTADGLTATLNDGKGSVTYTYDGGSGEHRRLLTSLTDSQAGPSPFTAIYNANGAIATETFPSGLVATRHFDDAGQTTSLAYKMGATTWLSFSATYSARGQVMTQGSNGSSQTFSYDNAGRLTQVADMDQTLNPAACTTRQYAYDVDSNRLTLTSYPAGNQGACSTSTSPTVTSHSYDEADRTSNTGYVYDPLGRVTAIPASDAGGTTLAIAYYATDVVANQSNGVASIAFGLDPVGRITTITAGNTTITNRYSASCDMTAWTSSSDGTWTRNVMDIAGNLSAIVSSTGSDELQLVNLHGDVVATAPNASNAVGTDAFFEATEFGVPRPTNSTNPRYEWLGGKLRDSADGLAGIVLMGVRLYTPTLGRFLQVDPIPGGSANSYDYCSADPLNCSDLSGTWGTSCTLVCGLHQSGWGMGSFTCQLQCRPDVSGGGLTPRPSSSGALGIFVSMSRILAFGGRGKGKWTCSARCQLRPTTDDPRNQARCQGWHIGGLGSGRTLGQACDEAIADLVDQTPRGCTTGHCHCRPQDCHRNY